MSTDFKAGAEIEVAHPFVREKYHGMSEDGPFETMTWRPGVRNEFVPPDTGEMVADGIGTQIMTVVSVHKPGKFPSRVFFTRRWRSPDGREFGKPKLCVTTTAAFRTRTNGYRHEFRVVGADTTSESRERAR